VHKFIKHSVLKGDWQSQHNAEPVKKLQLRVDEFMHSSK